MAFARCSVSFADSGGLSHLIHVQAESLYEAVARAIAGFRDDPLVPRPGSTTEFTVVIERPVREHSRRTSRRYQRQRVKALLNDRAIQTHGPSGARKT